MHSVGGRPRIRPAVVRWLSEAGHKFISSPDTGTIVVQVLPFAAEKILRCFRWQACLAVMKCPHMLRGCFATGGH